MLPLHKIAVLFRTISTPLPKISHKISVVLLLILSSIAFSQASKTQEKGGERPADPSLAEIKDEPGLPCVLLIGDSISMGYTLPVREKLKGIANVHRPGVNCGPTDRALADSNLEHWLRDAKRGDRKWDVIHFNFGLHDLKYVDDKGEMVDVSKGHQNNPPEVYEKNLRAIVDRLKSSEQSKGAKLIWCNTTPVPAGTTGRVQGDEIKYNEVAEKVMNENGIAIDDLHALIVPRQDEIQMRKNVHFNKKGYEVLADQVSGEIRKALGK